MSSSAAHYIKRVNKNWNSPFAGSSSLITKMYVLAFRKSKKDIKNKPKRNGVEHEVGIEDGDAEMGAEDEEDTWWKV